MIYRHMKWWPYIDTLATYGHLFNNFTIVYVAINYGVNLYMCFNVCCVCLFYCVATVRLNKKANENYTCSGLQSQCDIKMAQIITKRYKSESFEVFLRLRRTFWKIQFSVLLVAIWVSFPTSILLNIRGQFQDKITEASSPEDLEHAENRLASLDFVSFWLFICGLYKDGRPEN